jgi:hypothetical protein
LDRVCSGTGAAIGSREGRLAMRMRILKPIDELTTEDLPAAVIDYLRRVGAEADCDLVEIERGRGAASPSG